MEPVTPNRQRVRLVPKRAPCITRLALNPCTGHRSSVSSSTSETVKASTCKRCAGVYRQEFQFAACLSMRAQVYRYSGESKHARLIDEMLHELLQKGVAGIARLQESERKSEFARIIAHRDSHKWTTGPQRCSYVVKLTIIGPLQHIEGKIEMPQIMRCFLPQTTQKASSSH